MFSYKWAHEPGTKTCCLPDFPRYRRDKYNDKDLCKELHRLLNEAHVVVAHNAISFDLKKINSRLAVHGFTPPSQYKVIDTLREARKIFKFDSNKLDNIGRYLGEGRKISTTGAALWRGCYDGDKRAWRTMRRYGKRDTVLLARVYDRIKPWMPNHPNLNLYTEGGGCPTCQSPKIRKRGMYYGKAVVRQRLECSACGAQFSGEIIKTQTTLAPTSQRGGHGANSNRGRG